MYQIRPRNETSISYGNEQSALHVAIADAKKRGEAFIVWKAVYLVEPGDPKVTEAPKLRGQ